MTINEILKQEFCEEICEREDSCGGECRHNALTLIKERIREKELSVDKISKIINPYAKKPYAGVDDLETCILAKAIKSDMDRTTEDL